MWNAIVGDLSEWLPKTGPESDPFNLGDYATGSAIGNSGLYRYADESQDQFVRRIAQVAMGNGEWGTAGRSFNDLQNAGFVNALAPVTVDGVQYHRVGEDITSPEFRKRLLANDPQGNIAHFFNQYDPSSVSLNDPTYGNLMRADKYDELMRAIDSTKSDGLMAADGPFSAAGKTIGVAAGFAGAMGALGVAADGLGAAGAAGGATGAGSASLGESLANAGFMDFSAPGAFGSVASTTPGLSLSPLATSSGFSLAPGAGLTFEGMPIDQAWGVNPRLTSFIQQNGNPFEPGDNPISQMDFSQPQSGLSTTTPGLALDSLSTAGGASLAPGAGLIGSGGGFSLSDLTSFLKAGGNLSSLINAGGSVTSALIGSNAAQKAGQTQADASNRAADIQKYMFDTTRNDLMPWLKEGGVALGRVGELLGISGNPQAPGYGSLMKNFSTADLNADPIYGAAKDFQLGETNKLLTNAASARGETDSGVQMKDLLKYGTGILTGTAGDAFNRFNANKTLDYNFLAPTANLGQTTGVQLGNIGQTAGQVIGNNITSAGAATAAGGVGSANAINNAISQYLKSQQNSDIASQLTNFQNNPLLQRFGVMAE